MKCIHCSSNTNRRELGMNGGKCSACGHRFAFLPLTTPVVNAGAGLNAANPFGLADGAFQKCIERVSNNNTYAFTDRQLYYEVARLILKQQKRPGCGPKAAGVALLLGAGGSLAGCTPHELPLPFLGLGVLGALALAAPAAAQAATAGVRPPLTFAAFRQSYLDPWVKVHGKPEKLQEPVSPAYKVNKDLPSDLSAYSFDRALIVDNAEIAAMLVANRFHFENNCAILSFDRRFPAGSTFETVREMLGRNPNLIAFALHDATAEGIAMASELRKWQWFDQPGLRLIELGLLPRDAKAAKLLTQAATPPETLPAVAEMLPADDQQWLRDGNSAELACLRPAQLLRTVYRGFARANQMLEDDDWIVSPYGYYWFDSGPDFWVGGPVGDGAELYAADSFG